ncbi:hypothetical protein [Parvibaculum sp.]|uniref:hypothetical protein n=1 Tax=Parvibaculum sp. TaxID=2024848 RepID=UPI000C891860|nr:hypothetical protein [Parvibaculum sp.]MAB13088.1 hypothetical protein [Parvibaculum sp.]
MLMRSALIATSLILAAPLLAACDDDGPAEQAGEKIDNAVNDSNDTMEKAGESMDDAMDDMHDGMEDATGNQ